MSRSWRYLNASTTHAVQKRVVLSSKWDLQKSMRLQHHCYDSRIEVFDLHVRPVFRDVRALLEYTGVRIPEYMYTCIREYTST